MPNKRENRLLFYILSFTWGLPMTIVGLFVFLFTKVFLKNHITKIERVAGRICVVVDYPSMGGVSLGLIYIVGTWHSKALHQHELGHTIQNIRWGFLFPFIIGIPSIIRAALWPRLCASYYKKYHKPKNYYGIWFEGNASKLGATYLREEVKNAVYKTNS